MGGKTGQRRVGLLNRLKTFCGECGSGGKAGIRRAGGATRKEGNNRGRTIRKIRNGSRLLRGRGLLLLQLSILLSQKAVG